MKSIDRECGDCNLCCKLPNIDNGKFKKDYTWCKHCEIGVGCKIYPQRPKICKDFECAWKKNHVPDYFKPNKVGFYIIVENELSLRDKVFTIYAEEHRVHNIHKHLQKFQYVDKEGDEWRYCIRYNANDNDLALYDRKRFGNRIVFGKRGEIL